MATGGKSEFVESSDSVLISDLLYFAWNKLKSTPLTTIVSICLQFYTDDEYVFEEKKKFYESIDESKQCASRRSDTKRQKNLEDILGTMMRRDSRNEFLPKFASLDLTNVPVSDDGNPSLGQILASLNDLKRVMVTTDMLKRSLDDISAKIHPNNSSSLHTSSLVTTFPISASPSAPLLPASPSAPPLSALSSIAPLPAHQFASSTMPLPALSYASSATPPPALPPAPTPNVSEDNGRSKSTNQTNQFAAPLPPPPSAYNKNSRAGSKNRRNENKRPHDNQRPRDSSRPRTIIGKSVRDGIVSVKGADLTTNRYIGRWDNEVTTDGVKEFIASQDVTVVELEELSTKHGRFKSFRLRVKKSDLASIEDANFWPEGVLLSPFFRGKDEKVNGIGTPAATSQANG